MEKHKVFTRWAVENGVKINGVAAARFPNKGIGIIAERDIKANEVLVTVPTSALRTAHTVPKQISRRIGKITVHGLLAAELSLQRPDIRAEWHAVMPSPEDFADSMPIMWSPALQDLLPTAAKSLLLNQQKKLKLDWDATSTAYPEISYDTYLYNWLIVNTRTFFHIAPGTRKPAVRDDCMALNPFADYFNHAEQGCVVDYDAAGFAVTSNREYKKGEEVFISYGAHGNDFLLAEYGFIIDINKYDSVLLDDVILKKLNAKQKEELESSGFLGNYALDHETVCYRTQMALAMMCVPIRVWRNIASGDLDIERYQADIDEHISELLTLYTVLAILAERNIKDTEEAENDTRWQMLERRWNQIRKLLSAAETRLAN